MVNENRPNQLNTSEPKGLTLDSGNQVFLGNRESRLQRRRFDWPFKIGVIILLLVIAGALLLNSQNGRYQYVQNGNYEVIVDTRTGEFWTSSQSGMAWVDMRHRRVESGLPSVVQLK